MFRVNFRQRARDDWQERVFETKREALDFKAKMRAQLWAACIHMKCADGRWLGI